MTEIDQQSSVQFKPLECGQSAATFQSVDCTKCLPTLSVPNENWITVLETPCTFPPEIFSDVMLNLVENPNLTSSHLFRADVFYDSAKDLTSSVDDEGNITDGKLVPNLKQECRPIAASVPGFIRDRAIVRELVPRNPQLDKPLVQTCHFFHRRGDDAEEVNLVLYIPHIEQSDRMPFYHPNVQRLAFEHHWKPADTINGTGALLISFQLFPATELDTRLSRTALKLLQTVHKHGQGRHAGYQKRVQLDRILPQKRYQDRYARLKARYGKRLASQWVEVTDPGKHVFEDIGIAAFLIELWRDMYALPPQQTSCAGEGETDGAGQTSRLPSFPGFVDIGCGNGVLTYILLSEGYPGYGFDARERKTWRIFPAEVQASLRRQILVLKVLLGSDHNEQIRSIAPDQKQEVNFPLWHDGIFSKGTFIISNHADELTAWTPLLAYLNEAAFIAIPCCSHDFSGARFRAPVHGKYNSDASTNPTAESSQFLAPTSSPSSSLPDPVPKPPSISQAAETGTLARRQPGVAGTKMPSAYATLCTYVANLTAELGFELETEILRIPSTRNTCIVGRRRRQRGMEEKIEWDDEQDGKAFAQRTEIVTRLVEREMGRSIEAVGQEWMERVQRLGHKPGSGH